jgi:hypothetical protein
VVDGAGCDHEAWVEGTASDAAERVPCSCLTCMSERVLLIDTLGIHTVIEPIPKVGEAMLDKIFGGSEVEPRVDCSMAD